jgi:acyl-coenzyme A thioesterase PaaI-like protein
VRTVEFAPTQRQDRYVDDTPGRLRGVGRVVRRGREVAFLAGELRGADGSVVATATASAIIRSR